MIPATIPEVEASRIEYHEAAAAHTVAQAEAGEARKRLEAAELAKEAARLRLARAIGAAPDKEVIFKEGRREIIGRVTGIRGGRIVIEPTDGEIPLELDCTQVIPVFAHKPLLVARR